MEEQIVEIFESFVRESIALIVNVSLNVCKEISKFFLILLILYYFALWSFRMLDEFLLASPVPNKFDTKNYFRMEFGSEPHPVVSETFLRIGAPDEKLIQHRASLLEQLEIEAEFEENIKQHMNSENTLNNPEIYSTGARNSNEAAPFKDLFISQNKYETNETSRPSQTTKTSLGKKSKPKPNSIESGPQVDSSLIDEPTNKELRQEFDTDAMPTTSTAHEMPSSHAEQ